MANTSAVWQQVLYGSKLHIPPTNYKGTKNQTTLQITLITSLDSTAIKSWLSRSSKAVGNNHVLKMCGKVNLGEI